MIRGSIIRSTNISLFRVGMTIAYCRETGSSPDDPSLMREGVDRRIEADCASAPIIGINRSAIQQTRLRRILVTVKARVLTLGSASRRITAPKAVLNGYALYLSVEFQQLGITDYYTNHHQATTVSGRYIDSCQCSRIRDRACGNVRHGSSICDGSPKRQFVECIAAAAGTAVAQCASGHRSPAAIVIAVGIRPPAAERHRSSAFIRANCALRTAPKLGRAT